tara:strand:+ start:35169 stop:35603 length:435 start_codon:yes stop_codon:yes gene_type:complete
MRRKAETTLTLVSQRTSYPEVCAQCSAPITTTIAQHLVDGKLLWSRTRSCDSCGLAEVHDTDDTGMAFFRNLLITKCSYGVNLETSPPPKLVAELQTVFASCMPGLGDGSAEVASGRWRGTRPEAALLASALEERGYAAWVAER